ncbi:glycosyltransferase family 4 protein [Algisphaera agarilytica]|uniref:Glycosyltransferase involved in cell wall biosynthesis n=1 Tax=Algisphaera agarilytica TaxID=1385975 RepID=A0A7X0H5Q0_9BACT|nr:glycosyltransferase family 4 protein [Algisphaera agarilytica]MBB6428289.1 glycosyltransferase involved in cell wall biosynthesis [Algisphaera agarilytica]
MKIAIFHNRYKQPGGEDVAVEFEHRVLEDAGHEVRRFEVSNTSAFGGGKLATLCGAALTAARCRWDRNAMRAVQEFLEDFKPDVGHVHNWFPLFSPSIYQAHRLSGVPVIQTLHNYRLFCGSGTCWLDDEVCTDCLDGDLARAVRRGCYRGSRVQSAAWYRTMQSNRVAGVFNNLVDAYIAPSNIVADLHVKMGVAKHLLRVVPNGCLDAGFTPPPTGDSEAVFIGRLEPEKGISRLLEVWRESPWKLNVVGTGSLERELRSQYCNHTNICFHGQMPHDKAIQVLRDSHLALFPSLWLEPFGLGVIEAMSCGRPVITVGPGAPGSINVSGQSGIHLETKDYAYLPAAAASILGSASRTRLMGRMARNYYEEHYCPDAHLEGLLSVFEEVRHAEHACVA